LRAGESFTSLGPGQNGADLVYGGPQWERASWPPESRGKISIPCKIPSAGTTRKPFFFKRFRPKIRRNIVSLMPVRARESSPMRAIIRRRVDPIWLRKRVVRLVRHPVGIHFAPADKKDKTVLSLHICCNVS